MKAKAQAAVATVANTVEDQAPRSALADFYASCEAATKDKDNRNIAKGVGIAFLGYCVISTLAS